MSLITLDFETPFEKTKKKGSDLPRFSLTNLTYEEYLFDPRFLVMGVGIKIDDQPTQWYQYNLETGEASIREALEAIFTPNNPHILLCHNTMFDAAILSWHFGLQAATYWDTQGMSQALWSQASASLDKLTQRLFPDDKTKWKGKELADFAGKWPEDMSADDWATYANYCKNDVDITFNAFRFMYSFFPTKELEVIDMTIKMFAEPKFILDRAMIEDYKNKLWEDRNNLISASGLSETKLASNQQFCAYLKDAHGIDVPIVPSPTAKNPDNTKPALGKDDIAFIEMRKAHPDIEHIWKARIASKSNNNIKRCDRFLAHSERPEDRIAVYLKYAGASTKRWAGGNKSNFQNLGRGSALRYALKAPKDHLVVVRDLSNIEGRVNAWFSGQYDKCEKFANGIDLYNEVATKIFGYPVDRKAKLTDDHGNYLNDSGEIVQDKDDAAYLQWTEGFVGKQCLAAGTPVLTHLGWKPIEQVKTTDLLWDGVEWVSHDGLIDQGEKEVIELEGLWLTADHKILCGQTWHTAGQVAQCEKLKSQALATAKANLPLQATSVAPVAASQSCLRSVIAAQQNTALISTTTPMGSQKAVPLAPAPKVQKPETTKTSPLSPTKNTGHGCLTGSAPSLVGAKTPNAATTKTTAHGELPSTNRGSRTEACSSSTPSPLTAGTTQNCKSTELTTTVDTNPETFDLSAGTLTTAIDAPTKNSKSVFKNSKLKTRVYDLANAGPRTRFTVMSDKGPFRTHNCELGLGYGMGWNKFGNTCFIQGGLTFEDAFLRRTIDTWREDNYKIVQAWRKADRAIFDMASPGMVPYDWGCIRVERNRLVLPSGLHLTYPGLKMIEDPNTGRRSFEYWNGKHMAGVWGGTLIENIIQALARIIMSDMMLEIEKVVAPMSKDSGLGLTVHDEAVFIVPEQEAENVYQFMGEVMSTAPDWANDGRLPLASEGGIAENYSK